MRRAMAFPGFVIVPDCTISLYSAKGMSIPTSAQSGETTYVSAASRWRQTFWVEQLRSPPETDLSLPKKKKRR